MLVIAGTTAIHTPGCEFAAVLGDGFGLTWSFLVAGGDCSTVQGQRRDVKHIQECICEGITAVLGDGSVVTWGMLMDVGHQEACRELAFLEQLNPLPFPPSLEGSLLSCPE